MRAYRHLIKDCLSRKKTNFESILKGEAEIAENEKMSFPPGDFISVDGLNISLHFIVSIYTQSFFQSGRNCFDYIAQVIAEFFCKGIGFRNVDFGALVNKKDIIQKEDVRKFIESISSSEEYKYLCDYNNTVKYNYDPGVSISVQTDNLDMIGKMPTFTKNARSYIAADMDDQMKKVHQFATKAFGNLLLLIWPDKANAEIEG